ncbi:MAG TPA: inositol monophosphatase family protein [Alteraurantiacibacter sp.]|jgi:fructose-1,6-bisphosphatase/inositol monophosphatase family enzyme
MALYDDVSRLMRHVAAEVLVPRFRRLPAEEVSEKSPGEIVTSADLEAERRLAEGLARLCPSARVIGEEAVAADPQLLDRSDNGFAWLIDPLDGTANYASGRSPFGIMVALIGDGVPQLGWILDPLSGRMCFAERGQGATCNGKVVRTRPTGRIRPVAALGTHFLSPEKRERVHAAASSRLERVPVPMCAAESYPRVALGTNDIAMFQRILPWDHAAGALFVTEAGGCVTHWDCAPYRVGGSGKGILIAAGRHEWEVAAEVLLEPSAGLVEAERHAA